MKILAIVSGEYGNRHVENIQKRGPKSWQIEIYNPPSVLPLIIDYPEDYLPERLPETDLVLSFAESKSVAELLPEIATISGAKAVLVAVDNEAWLPRGLARQLHGWLEDIHVACATPKPLCSLTEHDYGITRRQRQTYQNAEISEFARHFGRPNLDISVDAKTRTIAAVEVHRDAVCGCARYVAEGIIGLSVDEVEEKAGLLHHHYPCLASMVKLPDFNQDTLMHESGNLLKENIAAQIKPYKTTKYISPGKRSG